MTTMSKPMRVTALGLDQRSHSALEMILKGPGKGAYVLTDVAESEAAIVDMDRPQVSMLWESYHRHYPERPGIALSAQDACPEGTRLQPKPVSINALLASLRAVAEELAAREAGTAETGKAAGAGLEPKVVSTRGATQVMEDRAVHRYVSALPESLPEDYRQLSDPASRAKLFFVPTDYIGGHLLEAIREAVARGEALNIHLRVGAITVDPAAHRVWCALTDTRLKQLCMVRANSGDGQALELRIEGQARGAAVEAPPGSGAALDLDAFVWKVAVWVSRGRAPEGTDLQEPVVLRHWPNLTRVLMTPSVMRVAAIWARQHRSPEETATLLRIPLSHVLTFYAAARATGLLVDARRQEDELFSPPDIDRHRQRGLLSRMLAKILGATQRSDQTGT